MRDEKPQSDHDAGAPRSGGPVRSQTLGSGWLTPEAAAEFLGTDPRTLRDMAARHARRAADGVTEARCSGVVARRFGRRWRFWLSNEWTEPESA